MHHHFSSMSLHKLMKRSFPSTVSTDMASIYLQQITHFAPDHFPTSKIFSTLARHQHHCYRHYLPHQYHQY